MVTSAELLLKVSDGDILGDPSDFRMGYNFKHRLIYLSMTQFPCNLEKGKTDLESPQGAEAKGHGSGTHSGGCKPLTCNLPKLTTPPKTATPFPPRTSVWLRFLRTNLAFNKYFLGENW